jgi:hypothetical protein
MASFERLCYGLAIDEHTRFVSKDRDQETFGRNNQFDNRNKRFNDFGGMVVIHYLIFDSIM